MSGLPTPAAALAARGLSEAGFEDRLILYRLSRRQGPMPVTVYSLAEALGVMASEFFVPDYPLISEWIAKTVGDHDLSRAIGEMDADEREEEAKRVEIAGLIARRIGQYRSALEK